MTSIPARVREIVHVRSSGRCEVCGIGGPVELHHRKFRSRGGEHTAQNLVALCGWGNHTGCHGNAHSGSRAVALGWSVNSWNRPESLPVRMFDGWFLLVGGIREPIRDDEAAELRKLYGMED